MNITASERHLLQGTQSLPLPDLLDLQIQAFRWFCFEGLEELIKSVFPVHSNDKKFELHFDGLKICMPSKSVYECLEKDLTYEAKISGIFSFHDLFTYEIKEQEVFMGNIPFMTPEGTFIVNGVERVIVSQLVRSPGVYFTKGEKRTASENAHMVKIVANRGAWIKYEYDFKKKVYQVKVDNPRRQIKVPITIFLKALGFEVDRDRRIISHPKLGYYLEKYLPNIKIDYDKVWRRHEMKFDSGLNPTLEQDLTNSQNEAQKEFWRKIHPTEPFSEDALEQLLPSKYFDPKRFDIAEVGRNILNSKLEIDIPKNVFVLTEVDLLESFRKLYYIQEYKYDPITGKQIRLDDVEHLNLENRRVEHIGELLVNQLRKGFQRIERIIKEKMMQPTASKESPKSLIHIKPLSGVIKEFFGSSKMSQLMDNANPLTSLTHKRRLSAMGPKGLSREAARFDFRDVHHSHYGRICPIESPEGQNIGLISSMATFASINSLGFIETPFFRVEKPGQVIYEQPRPFVIDTDVTVEEIKKQLEGVNLNSDLILEGFSISSIDEFDKLINLQAQEDIIDTSDQEVIVKKHNKVDKKSLDKIKAAFINETIDLNSINHAFEIESKVIISKDKILTDADYQLLYDTVQKERQTLTAYIRVEFAVDLPIDPNKTKEEIVDLLYTHNCKAQLDIIDPKNNEVIVKKNAKITEEQAEKIFKIAQKEKLVLPLLAPFRVLNLASLKRAFIGDIQTHQKYVEWLSADQEVPYNIAPSTTKFNEDWEITEEYVYVRKGDNFERVRCEDIDIIEVSPAQFISVTTSLIPFLEHDDANRALMGSNMQRQAVPLLHTEPPLVGTGNERKVAEDSGAMLLSPSCGLVEFYDSREIHLRKGVVYDSDTFEIIDIPRLHDLQAEEILTNDNFEHYYTRPNSLKPYFRSLPQSKRRVRLLKKPDRLELIHLRKYKRSNQGTLINHKIRIKKDQIIVKGELLADASSTSFGELALGRNVMVAFMPWRGYNYEDAILVSERLIHNDIYTSLHIEKHECEARPTKLGPEQITREITGISDDYIERNLDERGIIRVGAEVKAGDVLVGKITPKGESDLTGEEKLIRAVFGDKGKGFKNTPLKVPHGEDGVVIETQYFSREQGDDLPNSIHELVRVYVAKKRTLKVGDKMAGRHGNKGVVSRVLPVEDMPFLPDGTPVDIVLNPLGVPSRMNIGQVLETHLGLACAMINESHAEDYQDLIKNVDSISFDRSKRHHDLGKHDRIFFNPARKPLHIAAPVFESINEDTIRLLFKKQNLPLDGKTVLYDGLSGEPFIERVMVGIMYFMKLNHLVDDKMHARSTGSYALITQQPLGGKAQFGGQRLGEMEVWALEGYGAAYLLKEMLTVKSDDIDGRNKTYKAIVEGNIIPEPGIPESFNVMINELKTLCLDVTVFDENSEVIDLSEFDEEDRGKIVRDRDYESDLDAFTDNILDDSDMPELVGFSGPKTRKRRSRD